MGRSGQSAFWALLLLSSNIPREELTARERSWCSAVSPCPDEGEALPTAVAASEESREGKSMAKRMREEGTNAGCRQGRGRGSF